MNDCGVCCVCVRDWCGRLCVAVRDAGGEVIFMTRELRSFAHVLIHTSHPENVYLVRRTRGVVEVKTLDSF